MSPKPKTKPKAPQATSQTGRPKGLQLSAAQWRAYNQAYGAVIKAGFAALRVQQQNAALARRRQQFNAAVQRLRNSRLNAAYKLTKKTAAARQAASTASIAAFAAKMSYRQATLGHQNAALKARIFADYQRHVQQAARLQYAYKGENIYRHEAVMRTLTDTQAAARIQARQAAAAKAGKTANRAAKSASTSAAAASSTAAKAAAAKIRAQARAAGRAAAASVPPPAKRPVRHRLAHSAKPVHRVKQKKTKHKRRVKRSSGHGHVTSVHSVKPVTPVKKKSRTAPRPDGLVAETRFGYGDPDGYDCVAAAVAGHMLISTGYKLSARQYAQLVRALGPGPSIEGALEEMLQLPLWKRRVPLLVKYEEREAPRLPFTTRLHLPAVLGFETEQGPHAALLTGGRGYIASWKEVMPLASVLLPGTEVEEAWHLTWVV